MHVHLEITTQNSACIIFKNTSKAAFNDAFKNPKIQFTFHKKILSMYVVYRAPSLQFLNYEGKFELYLIGRRENIYESMLFRLLKSEC